MEWRAVKGYEGIYEVSENGDVRSLDREEIQPEKIRSGVVVKSFKRFRKGTQLKLNLTPSKTRYLVELNKDGVVKVGVHRLVYESFVGTIPEGFHIHHIDKNKFNNHYSNLKCVDVTEHNNIHAHPAWNKGISNPPEMVENARKAREISHMRNCEVVFNLRNKGLSWKEVAEQTSTCSRNAMTMYKRFEQGFR